MLRHVIAPSRDFTQIANAHVWDDSLSDAAFRLLVRSLALPPARARRTTVTELASGLTGGRITADRARRQLAEAGLLHCTRWRNATGQVRSESLVSSVPLAEAEVEQLFAEHVGRARPGAGLRRSGETAMRASGTALPAGEKRLREKTSPLPVPLEGAEGGEAERVLLSLRRADPRLVLGGAEVRRLVPLAAEWLARGVSSAGLVHALTAGLPQAVKSPAALLRCRLQDKMPDEPRVVELLVGCTGCERAFRSVSGEHRYGSCRQGDAEASRSEAAPGWRERIALLGATGG